MNQQQFFEKIDSLRGKFTQFMQHRKMIQAIKNHNFVVKMNPKQEKLFKCVRICLDMGFLSGADEVYLDHLLKEFDIFYLDWCHRTKQVKEKMGIQTPKKKVKTRIVIEQTYFDFAKTVEMPIIRDIFIPKTTGNSARL